MTFVGPAALMAASFSTGSAGEKGRWGRERKREREREKENER